MGVWIPELTDYFNTALSGIKVDGKGVTVSFAKPDILFRAEDVEAILPEINFKFYDYTPDKSRYESDILLSRVVNKVNNTIDQKKMPEPYCLHFQFILSAKNMDDIVQMEDAFLGLYPPRGVITVTDPSVSDTYSLDMFQTSYRINDLDDLNTPRFGQVPIRLFRRLFRYEIRVEHDVYAWKTTNTVTVVTPTVQPY